MAGTLKRRIGLRLLATYGVGIMAALAVSLGEMA